MPWAWCHGLVTHETVSARLQWSYAVMGLLRSSRSKWNAWTNIIAGHHGPESALCTLPSRQPPGCTSNCRNPFSGSRLVRVRIRHRDCTAGLPCTVCRILRHQESSCRSPSPPCIHPWSVSGDAVAAVVHIIQSTTASQLKTLARFQKAILNLTCTLLFKWNSSYFLVTTHCLKSS